MQFFYSEPVYYSTAERDGGVLRSVDDLVCVFVCLCVFVCDCVCLSVSISPELNVRCSPCSMLALIFIFFVCNAGPYLA